MIWLCPNVGRWRASDVFDLSTCPHPLAAKYFINWLNLKSFVPIPWLQTRQIELNFVVLLYISRFLSICCCFFLSLSLGWQTQNWVEYNQILFWSNFDNLFSPCLWKIRFEMKNIFSNCWKLPKRTLSPFAFFVGCCIFHQKYFPSKVLQPQQQQRQIQLHQTEKCT